MFAHDSDSLLFSTRHEEEGAYAVEMILQNLPPVEPFTVRWDWPLFRRADDLDPAKLKQAGGRPTHYKPEALLESLGDERLKTGEWSKLAKEEQGVSASRFFDLLKQLEQAGKVHKSAVDGRWSQIRKDSRNYDNDKDQ